MSPSPLGRPELASSVPAAHEPAQASSPERVSAQSGSLFQMTLGYVGKVSPLNALQGTLEEACILAPS